MFENLFRRYIFFDIILRMEEERLLNRNLHRSHCLTLQNIWIHRPKYFLSGYHISPMAELQHGEIAVDITMCHEDPLQRNPGCPTVGGEPADGLQLLTPLGLASPLRKPGWCAFPAQGGPLWWPVLAPELPKCCQAFVRPASFLTSSTQSCFFPSPLAGVDPEKYLAPQSLFQLLLLENSACNRKILSSLQVSGVQLQKFCQHQYVESWFYCPKDFYIPVQDPMEGLIMSETPYLSLARWFGSWGR